MSDLLNLNKEVKRKRYKREDPKTTKKNKKEKKEKKVEKKENVEKKKEEIKKSVLRLGGKDGIFKFETETLDNIKLGDLKKFIEKNTNVESSLINLTKHRNKELKEHYLMGNDKTLSKLGLIHGDMIYYVYTNKVQSKQDKEIEERRKELEEGLGDGSHKAGNIREIKKQWTFDEYMSYVESFVENINIQKYATCVAANVDSHAGVTFQNYLLDYAFTVNRMGFLYGTLKDSVKPKSQFKGNKKPKNDEKKKEEKENEEEDEEDENLKYQEAFIEAIYEPKQKGDKEGVKQLKDKKVKIVKKLAKFLKLKKIGWIFSHNGQRENPLTSKEILKIAEYQDKYGDGFVTITVSVNKDGSPEFEAYQVSRKCVELHKKGLLSPHPDKPDVIKTKNPVRVSNSERKSDEVDGSIFITNVPIKKYRGFLSVGFPVANRNPKTHKQSIEKLKQILLQRKNTKFLSRVSDFHLLLFLTDYLDMKSDIPALCEAIINNDHQSASGFEHLVNAYAGIE